MQDVKFYKTVVFVNSLIPLALLLWDAFQGKLGANPTEFALRTTGFLTLIFLVITLAVTPARKLTKRNELIKFRRMIGLFAFFYGFLHLTTYIWFDREFNFAKTAGDVWQRPFIAVGMTAFFLMVPLALTSTNAMIKRLGGKRWQQLHKLTYFCAIGGAIHYYMIVKSDIWLPLGFAAVLAILLGYRVFDSNRKAAAANKRVVVPK